MRVSKDRGSGMETCTTSFESVAMATKCADIYAGYIIYISEIEG
jgi:hypothetical protein